MKHLKIFENFESNEYYKEISEADYNPLSDQDYISLEEKYSDKLIELGFNCKINDRPINMRCCRIQVKEVPGSHYANGMNVFVFQRYDEYFDVEIDWISRKRKGSQYRPGYVVRERKYYRCDQFDGLLKLLKDKGII